MSLRTLVLIAALHFGVNYVSSEPCLDYMSLSLENATRFENGSVFQDGLVYPPKVQFTRNGELRGCPCLVKRCIRKCCAPGEYHDARRCQKSATSESYMDFSVVPSKVAFDFEDDLEDHFFILYQDGCLTESKFNLFVSGVPARPAESFVITDDGILKKHVSTTKATSTYEQERYCIAWSAKYNASKFWVCEDPEKIEEKEFKKATKWHQTIGNLISVLFLAMTFFVYATFPELRNIHGKTLMSNIVALAMAFTLINFIRHPDLQNNVFRDKRSCAIIAYIVHFSFLASFFWLNVMCFDIWWTFGGFRSLHGSVKQRERKKFIMYSIYAWGCASIITITCIIMDQVPGIPETFIRPEFGKGSCWFFSDKARFLYFYLPMAITIICNICLFVLTALKLVKHKKDTARQLKGSDSRRHDDNKQWFNLYLKLFIVMGINWSTEIISWLFEEKLKWLWYITDLTNTLQGVIIFVIFVWKDKIKRLLLKRFGCDGGNFLSRNSNSRTGCANANSVSTRTCVTTAPLHEKSNPYSWKDSKGKSNMTFDESDGV